MAEKGPSLCYLARRRPPPDGSSFFVMLFFVKDVFMFVFFLWKLVYHLGLCIGLFPGFLTAGEVAQKTLFEPCTETFG